MLLSLIVIIKKNMRFGRAPCKPRFVKIGHLVQSLKKGKHRLYGELMSLLIFC
jgi:hypothetical protein